MKTSDSATKRAQFSVSALKKQNSPVSAHKRSKKKFLEATQQRRLRTAGITVVAFICMLLLLSLEERLDEKAKANTKPVAQYVIDSNTSEDPLSLVNRVATLELVGVSNDGSVIGYASDLPVQFCVLQMTIVLETDGWILFDDNKEGLLSFYRTAKSETEKTTLFVQCLSVGQGCSIVINRW